MLEEKGDLESALMVLAVFLKYTTTGVKPSPVISQGVLGGVLCSN